MKRTVEGQPDEKHISTSFVERQNLTMRMQMRRFTRLTNAFSKKLENHMHMVALYTVWYNFIRVHKTLRVTPAVEAGLSETVWDMEDLVRIMDERAPKSGRPATYNKISNDALPRLPLRGHATPDGHRRSSRTSRHFVSQL